MGDALLVNVVQTLLWIVFDVLKGLALALRRSRLGATLSLNK